MSDGNEQLSARGLTLRRVVLGVGASVLVFLMHALHGAHMVGGAIKPVHNEVDARWLDDIAQLPRALKPPGAMDAWVLCDQIPATCEEVRAITQDLKVNQCDHARQQMRAVTSVIASPPIQTTKVDDMLHALHPEHAAKVDDALRSLDIEVSRCRERSR